MQSGRRELNPRSRAPATNAARRCPAEYQAFLRPVAKSAQRELNPHFRHGKAAGCRYIMGAIYVGRIVKDREHRAGLEPA